MLLDLPRVEATLGSPLTNAFGVTEQHQTARLPKTRLQFDLRSHLKREPRHVPTRREHAHAGDADSIFFVSPARGSVSSSAAGAAVVAGPVADKSPLLVRRHEKHIAHQQSRVIVVISQPRWPADSAD